MGTVSASNSVLRAGIYVRYSTNEQHQNSFSAEMQRSECLKALEGRYPDAHHEVRYFEDLAVSGAVGVYDPTEPNKPHRQGLTDLLDAIASDEIDVVAAYAQDRLARDEYLWHYMMALFFAKHDVPVLFARDGHDVTSEEGRTIASFQAWAAALERRKTSRNVSASVRQKVEQGYHHSYPPFGWQWDPKQKPRAKEYHRIVRDEVQGAVLMEIRDRYVAGWSPISIVRDLHEREIKSPSGDLRWNKDSVLKALRNPLHAGLVQWKGELFPGQHADQSYWSPEERDEILAIVAQRKLGHVKRSSAEKYLLTGLLYCGHCGRRLICSHSRTNATKNYVCERSRTGGRNRVKRDGHYGPPRECPGFSRSTVDFEKAVYEMIRELATSVHVQAVAERDLQEALDHADDRLTVSLKAVEREIAEAQKVFSKLFDMLQREVITEDEFRTENALRRDQLEALEAHQQELSSSINQRCSRQAQMERAVELLRDFDHLWDKMDFEEKRQLLATVDPHMMVMRESNCLTLTMSPGFAPPLSRNFPISGGRHRDADAPVERLTPRELAFLALWPETGDLDAIAKRWNVRLSTVQDTGNSARKKLGVDTLDQAAQLAADKVSLYRDTLPLTGRSRKLQQRDNNSLSDPLKAVLNEMAKGKGCVEIAEALGKDKSTISRQMKQVCGKLGVDGPEEAVAKGKGLGLVE